MPNPVVRANYERQMHPSCWEVVMYEPSLRSSRPQDASLTADKKRVAICAFVFLDSILHQRPDIS